MTKGLLIFILPVFGRPFAYLVFFAVHPFIQLLFHFSVRPFATLCCAVLCCAVLCCAVLCKRCILNERWHEGVKDQAETRWIV